jgi:tetratricopeptide (TPR) repeat protein
MDEPVVTEGAARLERLLRDAHIQRMRQQWAAAEALCRQALEIAPEDPMGLEMLGDCLNEKGSVGEALETYRKALALQPEKAALEEKVARTVLLQAEEDRQRMEAQLLLTSPRKKGLAKRNTAVALMLSVLCPGAGHVFLGQSTKGIILIVVWVLFLFSGAAEELFKLMVAFGGGLPRGERVNDVLAGFGVVGTLAWLYGLIDSSAIAGRAPKGVAD